MSRKAIEPTENGQLLFLSDCEQSLYHLITQRTGIVLRNHQVSVLRHALVETSTRFGYMGVEVLLRELERKKSESPEFEFLLTKITVGESYFFRDDAQISLLRDELVPQLIARKRRNNDYSLRVWSAGCSSGQEIYSLVIMLDEMLPDIHSWKLYFLATDINTNFLADALRGCYSAWSLRATPELITRKYFKENQGEYQLRGDICQQVKFVYLNLAADPFPALHTGTHAIDILLCRNVFIYLEPKIIQRIVSQFAQCLVPDGFLLLGHADFVDDYPNDLDYVQRNSTSYFRRRPVSHFNTPILPQYDVDKIVPSEIAGELNDGERLPKQSVCKIKKNFEDISYIMDFLRAERWYDALLVINEAIGRYGESAALLQVKSKALANLGRLPEALQTCQKSLALDSTEKHTYLLQGMIFIESAQAHSAEEALRKAIFLDHTFSEAHYQLGLLLMQQGNQKAELKCLAHALTHAENELPQHEVHNAPGMTYARFVEIIQTEMSIYANMIPDKKLKGSV